jgi:hypothetical protein
MKTKDIPYIKTYHLLTELERTKMLAYYQTHTLKECAVKWRISEEFGLPQFLTRGNPKAALGGARFKTKIPPPSEFELFKKELEERLGKDGKALLLKLLKLYEDEKAK